MPDNYYPRYEPAFLSVSLVKEDEHIPLFPTINVELIPQPEPSQLVTHTSGGSLTATYDPAPLIWEIINFYAWLHNPPVTVISEYMEENGCSESEAREALEYLYCSRVQTCVETGCNYMRERIQSNLEYALTSLLDESFNRTFAVRNGQDFTVTPMKGLIKREIREHIKRQRQVVNLPTRGGNEIFYTTGPTKSALISPSVTSIVFHSGRQPKKSIKRIRSTMRKKLKISFCRRIWLRC